MTAKRIKAKPALQTTATGSKAPADDDKQRDQLAKDFLEPCARHGELAVRFTEAILNGTPDEQMPHIGSFYVELHRAAKKAESGDLSIASRLLVAQAISLDGIFTEMARRAASNMREYPQAMQIYMRLALKAQAGSRATLAELAKLHQPREQTVRHVHVNEGGQAVIADQFHYYTGGKENGTSTEQHHAQGPCGPALPCPDPQGNGVPIPGDQGCEAVPNARRQRQRRTQGQ
jgi:hypothetical protein